MDYCVFVCYFYGMKKDEEICQSRNANGFNTLASSLLPIVRKILGKKGMITADLIAMWGQIVGTEVANYCEPEKVEFRKGEKTDGVLRLKVSSGASALEIKHREKSIVEKVNSFFGYGVISKIKLIQNINFIPKVQGVDKIFEQQKMLVSKEEENYIRQQVKDIENEGLREKLFNLGKRVFNENRK